MDGSSIIRLPVTFRTLRLHADELVRGVVRVLRMGLLEDPARRVQQAASLADCVDARLNEATRRVRARVDVTLRPRVDRGRAP